MKTPKLQVPKLSETIKKVKGIDKPAPVIKHPKNIK